MWPCMTDQIIIFVETFEMNIINSENKYRADRNTTFKIEFIALGHLN